MGRLGCTHPAKTGRFLHRPLVCIGLRGEMKKVRGGGAGAQHLEGGMIRLALPAQIAVQVLEEYGGEGAPYPRSSKEMCPVRIRLSVWRAETQTASSSPSQLRGRL